MQYKDQLNSIFHPTPKFKTSILTLIIHVISQDYKQNTRMCLATDAACVHLKNLPSNPLVTLLAIPPVSRALPAIFDAWPNLSHLEKASVLVIVKDKAITVYTLVAIPQPIHIKALTNKRQPY
jgi:hypothetical protein